MSAPARRRPGSVSPIALTPDLQPIKTARADDEGLAARSLSPGDLQAASEQESAAATTQEPAPQTSSVPATAAAPAAPAPNVPGPKVTRTYKLDLDLVQRAETAVLRAGVHRSMTGMVAAALERELERLANECNDGVPYPPNTDQFRTGRPVGS